MGRFIILSTLLLGLVGVVNGQFLGQNDNRQEFAPVDGCVPGMSNGACPVRMECFADGNFENGGRCDCNPLWYKTPMKLPFNPDSEFDDGFTTSDCKNNHLARFVVAMFYAVGVLLNAGFIYTDVAVIKELVRVKALKWNATTYSLFWLLYCSFGLFSVDLIYLFNTWDADKTEFWYRIRSAFFSYFLILPNVIIDFEVGVTWIDLYDRTNRMSKSTSKVLKGFRWSLRAVALGLTLAFYFMARSGGMLNLLISALGPSVAGMIFVTIGGRLIVRTLCPDHKDVANPNWKVAEAIRRAVKQAAGAHFLEALALIGMAVTGRHPQLGYLYGLFCALYFFSYVFRMWGWLHYLIYGSRKHLKKYSSENASAYFGFSTIGLNKTLTTASSRMSAMSSRSSVAASTVEKD